MEAEWLGRRGRSRRERIRNKKTREELGAKEMVIEKIKRKRLAWFGHVERMEGKKTNKRSTAWACERRKKQQKTKEEMGGQCQRRFGREAHTIIYRIEKFGEI